MHTALQAMFSLPEVVTNSSAVPDKSGEGCLQPSLTAVLAVKGAAHDFLVPPCGAASWCGPPPMPQRCTYKGANQLVDCAI